jgi:hypothetical protein
LKQRVEANEKNIMNKIERAALDDPNVMPTYDLWNVRDEKKGMNDCDRLQ